MGGNHADIDRHVRVYMAVFATLLVFTGLTVAAWKWGPAAVGPTIVAICSTAGLTASGLLAFAECPFLAINGHRPARLKCPLSG